MSRIASALRSLPLEDAIGAPLNAAVRAQAFAAKTTVDFIQEVGFIKDKDDPMGTAVADGGDSESGKVRNVTFSYEVQNADDEKEKVKLIVPILTIVPIPFLRIDAMTIDFRFRITEQTSTYSTDQLTTNENTIKKKNKSFWFFFRRARSYSGTFTSSNSSVAKRSSRFLSTATLDVHVHAVQDEIPAGLGRVLNILEDTIKETRTSIGDSKRDRIEKTGNQPPGQSGS